MTRIVVVEVYHVCAAAKRNKNIEKRKEKNMRNEVKFADEVRSEPGSGELSDAAEPEIVLTAENTGKEIFRCAEVVGLRTADRKVFDMSDGTEQAVFYSGAVHVFDGAADAFVDADAGFVCESDGRHYAGGGDRFRVRFSAGEENSELFSFACGEHGITVSARENGRQRSRGTTPVLLGADGGGEERLVYSGVQGGSDYEYSVVGNGVKENIVVRERAEEYRYSFIIHPANVTFRPDDGGKRIAFIANGTGEEVFFIPAPFMTDGSGAVSTDVSYITETAANGNLILTIAADSGWMNAEDRIFPVVIDPQIQVSGASAVTTYSSYGGNLYGSYLHTVGVDGCCRAGRMYMTLRMPALPRNPEIKKAELVFRQSSGTGVCGCNAAIGLYRADGAIAAGERAPDAGAGLIDYAKMRTGHCEDGEVIEYTFDITSVVDQLCGDGEDTAGLVLKAVDEDSGCGCSAVLYGSGYGGENAPQLVITYASGYGVDASSRVHSHELGRFGRGYVDLRRGNLMFESEDFAWSGNRMPVTVKHFYNSALGGHQYTADNEIMLRTADFSAMKVGNGFRLSMMQSMVPAVFRHEGVTYSGYVNIGENGEETYFRESGRRVCCGSGSQCYSLYENADGGEMIYDPVKLTLTLGDETSLFDAFGRLIKITDGHGNHTDITYEDGRIVSVTDGAGRDFLFGYSGDHLVSISAPDGSEIHYSYSGDQLCAAAYPDGRRAEIAYASGKPAAVNLTDASGNGVYRMVYTFSGDRLSEMTEYGVGNGGYVAGNRTVCSYSAASGRTAVETYEPDDGSGDVAGSVTKTVYTFDSDGNTVSEYVYTEETGNVGVSGDGSGIHPHSGDGGAGVVCNINNLLRGHGFETVSDWTAMPGNDGSTDIAPYSHEVSAKYGKSVLRIRTGDAGCSENGVYQATGVLPAGQYTFSAYCRVLSAFSGEGAGAYIRVTDADGDILGISEKLFGCEAEYTRLIVPFELDAAQSVRAEILADGCGTAYADAAQLENNQYANPYNMLDNGNFERETDGWVMSPGVVSSSETKFNMSRSLMMTGNIYGVRYAYQQPDVRSARSTRETFTLSGWAKGWAIPDHSRYGAPAPTFRLRAVVKYADTVYGEFGAEEFTADFSPCTEEWQFASVQFSKSKYRAVQYIRVYCDYDFNSGEAYFDDIQLVRDSIETGLAAADFVVESTGVSDDEVEESTDSTPEFSEAVDRFGNALTETAFTDGEFGTIYRAFGFNDDNGQLAGNDAGNNLVRETDARGNDTTYTVNSLSSRNEEVVDRLGNKTAYEYDVSGRTTKVTSKKGDGTELANVSYAYDSFDNMTEIARGDGMKYALTYNAFHNLESIGVNGKADKLIRYDYKNGSGRLKQITYANGDAMKATYNSVGQMVAEKWYNAANTLTAHYKYVYDGQGNIVRSLDILAGIEYNYTYENGRIVRAAESSIILSGEIVTAKNLVSSILYSYDSEGKLTKKRIIPVDGAEQVVYYETSDDNTVVKFSAGGRTVTSHSKTDSFGRKVFDELQLGTGFVSRQFHYHSGDVTDEHVANEKLKSSATTQLVSQIVLSGGRTLSYEYDAEERITKVTDSVGGVAEYVYDALGQLVSETVNGVVVNSMEYDNYGNITKKNGKVYGYDSVWKDLLVSYDGQSVAYDAQGNPVSYLGHNLTWEKGRQLKSFDTNTYTYNANGIRTSKTVDGIKHTYTLDGTKILREEWTDENTSHVIIPLYDNEDSVCGIDYNGEPYYFIRNLQGDVIAIVDRDSETVARYSYDAWGVPEIKSDLSECLIADINPFRYRGYYYDSEIGMYYLQSRYYDAGVGRFISPDDPTIFNNSSNMANMSTNKYCYCQNSPSNDTDECGTIAGTIVKMIGNFLWGMLGGMLGLYLANVTLNIASGQNNIYEKNDTWGKYIAEGVKSGAFAIFGSKLVYKIMAVVGASVLKQFVDMLISKKSFNFREFLIDIFIGIAVVLLIHFGSSILKKLSSKKKKNSSKWIEKIKEIIKKIADYLIKKLGEIIDKLVSFFKNVFVKRFSISYAKRIGAELKKIFTD